MTASASFAEDYGHTETETSVGLNIEIERNVRPYVLKYYIPCIAIVVMSQLSFLIPLDSLPGRVGLVVTQFLTLMSLFIQQMVKYEHHMVISLPIQIMIDHKCIFIVLCVLTYILE